MLSQCIAVCCGASQCIAVCCSVLQCITVNKLWHWQVSRRQQCVHAGWRRHVSLELNSDHYCHFADSPLIVAVGFVGHATPLRGGRGGRGRRREKVTLKYTDTRYLCVIVHCRVLQGVAGRCSVLQCVVVCCTVLQCAAVCCSVLQREQWEQCVAVCCSLLQCVAVRCCVLQSVAECCRVLQFVECSSVLQ